MSQTVPVSSDLQQRRDRGVARMNRGHALQQLGDSRNLSAAIAAYAEAVVQLESLQSAENPAWANSLGAALMNHGQLLHRAHGIARASEVLTSLDRAIEVLRQLPADENPWPRRNLAGSHLNRASVLLDLARAADARRDAQVALQLAAPHERADLVDADLALKSRRTLCDALGQLLVTPSADQDALASEASDLVDDGLALARHWIQRGAPQPRELAIRLFRFGAQLYRVHQPHFLAEFIQENLCDGHRSIEALAKDYSQFHAIAIAAIDSALTDQPHDQKFLTIGDPVSERRLLVWRELATLRARLVAE